MNELKMNDEKLNLVILAETAIHMEKAKNEEVIESSTLPEQATDVQAKPVEVKPCKTVPKKCKLIRSIFCPDAQINPPVSSDCPKDVCEPLDLSIGIKSQNPKSLSDCSSEESSNSTSISFDASTTDQKSSSPLKKSSKKLNLSKFDLKKNSQLNKFIKESIKITPRVNPNGDDSLDNIKIEVKTANSRYIFCDSRKRKPSTKTPESMKDEDYFKKRKLNNEAARKSRSNKELAIKTSQLKLQQLEEERKHLNEEFEIEILMMKQFQLKMSNDSEYEKSVTHLFDEGKLSIFKELLKNGPLD